MRYDEEMTGAQMDRAEWTEGTVSEFATLRFPAAHHPAERRISGDSAQLTLGLDAVSDIDFEDQAKGRPGWVVRRNPITGERQLDNF